MDAEHRAPRLRHENDFSLRETSTEILRDLDGIIDQAIERHVGA
jgi:hypothetical protein